MMDTLSQRLSSITLQERAQDDTGDDDHDEM